MENTQQMFHQLLFKLCSILFENKLIIKQKKKTPMSLELKIQVILK